MYLLNGIVIVSIHLPLYYDHDNSNFLSCFYVWIDHYFLIFIRILKCV